MRPSEAIFRNLFLCLALISVSLSAQSKAITLCYEDEDAFPWMLKHGKGLNSVLLEQVAASLSIDLKLVGTSWKRCLLDVESGQVNGSVAASYKEDRTRYAVYPTTNGKPDPSRRIYSDSYSLYRLKGSQIDWNGREFSKLAGLVGVQSGYSIADDLKKLGVKIDDSSKTTENLMEKLVADRVQAIAALTLEADHQIRRNKDLSRKIQKIKTPLSEKPYFVIFGKDFYNSNPKAIEEFWTKVAAVRNSAGYKAKEVAILKERPRTEPQ